MFVASLLWGRNTDQLLSLPRDKTIMKLFIHSFLNYYFALLQYASAFPLVVDQVSSIRRLIYRDIKIYFCIIYILFLSVHLTKIMFIFWFQNLVARWMSELSQTSLMEAAMFWLLQALPLVSLWSSLLANKIYIFFRFWQIHLLIEK